MSDKSDKKKILEEARKQIEKRFGTGAIIRFGEKKVSEISPEDVIPTGALSLDIALGVGGYPRGRIIEIYGAEATGKTTLVLHAIAEVQKRGGTAVFVDTEHAFDPSYAKSIGVNVDELYLSQPDYAEQALEIAETMIRSGAVDLIAVDSVAALVPEAEVKGEMGESQIGLQARLMSHALRKLTGALNKSRTCAIFTNQIRYKIQTWGYGGEQTTTPGGLALKFYASVRIELKRITSIKDTKEDRVIGNRIKMKIVKNKVAPPYREAEVDIIFGEGFNKIGDVLDLAEKEKIVAKSGAWYSYGTTKLGQGRANAIEYLKKHQEILKEIENKLREKYGLPKIE